MSRPSKRYDVCAGRPYKTRDGAEKKDWIRVGELTEWEDGTPSIRLHAIPTGSWFDGNLKCLARDEDSANGGGRGQQRQTRAEPQPQRQAPVQQSGGFDDFDDLNF